MTPSMSEQTVLAAKLREKTACGIMDCKIALRNNDWDLDKAQDELIHTRRKERYDRSPTDIIW